MSSRSFQAPATPARRTGAGTGLGRLKLRELICLFSVLEVPGKVLRDLLNCLQQVLLRRGSLPSARRASWGRIILGYPHNQSIPSFIEPAAMCFDACSPSPPRKTTIEALVRIREVRSSAEKTTAPARAHPGSFPRPNGPSEALRANGLPISPRQTHRVSLQNNQVDLPHPNRNSSQSTFHPFDSR